MAHGLSRIIAAAVLTLGLLTGVSAQNLDPDRATFDPESKFVITPFGAIIGDPAQLTELGTGRTGFTYCSTAPPCAGITTDAINNSPRFLSGAVEQ